MLKITEKENLGKYLGAFIDMGISKHRMLETVVGKIKNSVTGWGEQFLSSAGKELLIKTIAYAIPTYQMACFKFPITTCKDITSLLARYWWNNSPKAKGLHWCTWKELEKDKDMGGMGFKELSCFNMAFLAK